MSFLKNYANPSIPEDKCFWNCFHSKMSYDDTNSRLDTQIDELSNLVRQKPKIAKNQQVGQVHQQKQKLDMFIKIQY